MSTLKTPKDNNKKAGSGRTMSDKDRAIMGRALQKQLTDFINNTTNKAAADTIKKKTKKRPVAKSRMMNKDGSDPLMKKKALVGGRSKLDKNKNGKIDGGMAKKKMKVGGKLVGGQSKIDRDKNGVINAKDFKIMNEKAYGGMAKKKKMMGGGMMMKKKMMGGGMMKKKR